MDKSKLGILGVLAILGAALFFSKAQDAPAPSADPDEAEHSDAKPEKKPAKADADLAGGMKALKIEDVRLGSGAAAQNGDNLTMNYKGSLLNGTVFDQSYGKSPFQFQLGSGQVIKGWDEGIKGMKVGGKRKLTIPASLGYGEAGQGSIPPGATLLFEVELLKIAK